MAITPPGFSARAMAFAASHLRGNQWYAMAQITRSNASSATGMFSTSPWARAISTPSMPPSFCWNCSSIPSEGSTPVMRAGWNRSITACVVQPVPQPTSSTSS